MQDIIQTIAEYFNNPYWIILSAIITIITILLFIISLLKSNIFIVLYRFARGLYSRDIAIFADNNNFNSLKELLTDSKIFKENNIHQIDKKSIDKAGNYTIFLVHYLSFEDKIDNILSIKKDSAALIIYAPQEEGKIKHDILQKINEKRNSIIVNFGGRLLNDILISMITTSYN